jgi:F420-dependent oxidoreductase-like protein
MKIATPLQYADNPRTAADEVVKLEAAGLDAVWVMEAYGFDSPTVMGYIAARTERMQIGAAILNVYSRTPALLAQTGAGLDVLSEGRALLGLGASGPQVVEGWHGKAYDKPLARTREAVELCRRIWRREIIDHHGLTDMPLPAEKGGKLGKPLKFLNHPERAEIPIYIAALGPANVRMTAEIADGWLPLGFVPRLMPMLRPWLEEGFRRAGHGKGFADFEIQPRAEVIITDDVRGALARQKPRVALYAGGMGHRDKNFHKEMMIRRGFGDAAQRIQELYLAKRKDEAVAAVPDEFCDEMSLVGPAARIRERYRAWADSGITGLTIVTEQPEAMELMASLR